MEPGTETMRNRERAHGTSWRLWSTAEGGEPGLPGPAGGKGGAARKEPSTGNTGQNPASHKPVHETAMASRHGEDAPGPGVRLANHALDLEWMLEAHRTTRKEGAAGIDGTTAAD